MPSKKLTVGRLMEILQCFQPDTEVLVGGAEDVVVLCQGEDPVFVVNIDTGHTEDYPGCRIMHSTSDEISSRLYASIGGREIKP